MKNNLAKLKTNKLNELTEIYFFEFLICKNPTFLNIFVDYYILFIKF